MKKYRFHIMIPSPNKRNYMYRIEQVEKPPTKFKVEKSVSRWWQRYLETAKEFNLIAKWLSETKNPNEKTNIDIVWTYK